ncbi:MAG: ubiquinone/menaquinone biosynthesis methyltransferase [Candidatus Eisenbacteria bacterium]|nr:ubiquinone/menaquinone biosynthesis methyltransferase [Candidatus Eisenbacteria bacterium]
MSLEPSRVTDPRGVFQLFNRIAPRYDLVNRLMSLGRDLSWRRDLLELVRDRPGPLLDLCAGTGDVALMASRHLPGRPVLCADGSAGMLRRGLGRDGALALAGWVQADALRLPLREASLGSITVAFGVRNVVALDELMRELRRTLRPGGRLAVLDIFAPASGLVGVCYGLYLRHLVPALGAAVGGDGAAYRHLSASVRAFGRPGDLAARMEGAGFRGVGFRSMQLGAIGLVWGEKG